MDRLTIDDRLDAVAEAVASQRLEGLDVDAVTIGDLERAARGEIEVADVLDGIRERISRGEV